MGDYNKLIVTCSIKKSVKKELMQRLDELSLGVSAYQSSERVISIEPDTYNAKELNVIIVGQTKYGQGQEEFCDWLRQYVVQGSGLNDVYAMSFSEYTDEPRVWKLSNHEEYASK